MMKKMKSVLWIAAIAIAAQIAAEETPEAAAAVAGANKAVEYLVKQQNENGTFGKATLAPSPGIVGLALKGIVSSPNKPRESNPAVSKAAK